MSRAAHLLSYAACFVGVACGHEVSTPSTVTNTQAPTFEAPAQPQPAAPLATPGTYGCIEVDADLGGKRVTLDGLIVVDDTFEHPSRGKTRPLILRLDVPRCAMGTDEPRIAELHLAASEGLTLKPFIGKHVRVSGDPFTAHTAWHARPIVLMTTSATLR